ncbi:MAG: Rieske 2Fe-2S domain-containing protein [Gammaproteobacteria bacterium]
MAEPLFSALPWPGAVLGPIADFPEGRIVECVFGAGREPFRIIVLRKGDSVHGFINRCPHFQLPLNLEPGRFLMWDDDEVMCIHHSATFRLSDGYCTGGPCLGMRLDPFPLELIDGRVVVT